ncbi:MAG: PASTA domain-containing protein [Thermoleophilia bacterium]
MAARLVSILPRFAIVTFVFLFATAAVTFAAGKQIASNPAKKAAAAPVAAATLVVPDVRNQAFVFAKGSLEDNGFAWRVAGSVHGFAANTVAAQSPAAGVRVIDTGAPLVTVTLLRNGRYTEHGAPEDASLLRGTKIQLADIPASPIVPARPAKAAKPAAKKAAPLAPPKVVTPKKQKQAMAVKRPPAFVIPGARKEPLKELPLPDRARLLGRFIEANPRPTNANVKHWLYQHEWIVTGAKLGWWHGAEALRILIGVDAKAQTRWGVGSRSAEVARRALAGVEARTR